MIVKERVSPRLREIERFAVEGSKVRTISIGVHGAEGGARHNEEAGLSIADIAERHEFGLGVPQRAFLRGWFGANERKLHEVVQEQLRLAVQRGETVDWALERAALWAQADIQKQIAQRTLNLKPLAESTIAAKGSDVPLIDTGVLRAAILAKVNAT